MGLMEILGGRLEAYHFIAPHILMLCQKSSLLIEHLLDKDSRAETLVNSLELKVYSMHEEAMAKVNASIRGAVGELGGLIKGEIKKMMEKSLERNMRAGV